MIYFRIIFIILGLWFTIAGFILIWGGFLSNRWPVAKGKILESRIKSGKSAYGMGPSAYWIYVRYSYSINGKEYSGKRYSFGKYGTAFNNTTDRAVVEEMIQGYKKGNIIDVYYSPGFHYLSVLIPGFHWASIFIFVVGVLWSLFGTGYLL